MCAEPAQMLAHYRLIEKIGESGMGVVYRAEDVTLRRLVALKFVTGDTYDDEHLRARFLREARTAAALNHPSICTIHEVGEIQPGEERSIGENTRLQAGMPFIAMELIQGRTLQAVLAQSGPLKIDRLLALAVQIAEGLAAARTNGIVHRDLKPGNVMVILDSRIKILDFGLARPVIPADEEDAVMTAAETVSARLTQKGMVLGTVAYMSPEQALGRKVDTRSDVFSFRIMLFEMAAGKRPFEGESPTSTLAKYWRAIPSRSRRSDQTCPGNWRASCGAVCARTRMNDSTTRGISWRRWGI